MSGFEAAAGQAKATKLAFALIAHGADAATAQMLPPQGRRMAAKIAGTRVPSDQTWDAVLDILRSAA